MAVFPIIGDNNGGGIQFYRTLSIRLLRVSRELMLAELFTQGGNGQPVAAQRETAAATPAMHFTEASFDCICDPLPIDDVMIRALQKTDPRCKAQPLTTEAAQGLQPLQAALPI